MRRPDRGFAAGTEPDYRFTLANERTFLAWMRTALGLIAGGITAHQLLRDAPSRSVPHLLATVCITAATVLAVAGYFRWRRIQIAMRQDQPLPRGRMLPFMSLTVISIAAVAMTLVLR
ncbi:YidH family protein [Streptomyces viridochromogenes]|uniref:DUF202 domain-containing protein n=1 Tax=Streptomyces viridochromogenes Tue57 TaxID=1160705 RepID=L8PS65_STRVR|nr:DUF202 domain-containing protein [Streptomyces viridochromogenes]ELS58222.1 hypothetical protein STVIR_0773 [Streptomyces viridochromogenes Tue57]